MCLPDLPPGSEYNDQDKVKPATRTCLVRDTDDDGDVTVRHRGGFPLRFARAALEIPSYYAPLELDFAIVETKLVEAGGGEVTETFDGPRRIPWPQGAFAVPLGMSAGFPAPLGASRMGSGLTAGAPGWVNFALHSAQAEKVTLFLQWTHGGGELPETMEIALNPVLHRTGRVWHVALPVGVRGAMLPMPAPASAGWLEGTELASADQSEVALASAAVLYGYKCDGDPQKGGWRFHPALVM